MMSFANLSRLRLRAHNLTFSALVHRIQKYSIQNQTQTLTKTYNKFDEALKKWNKKIIFNSLIDRLELVNKYANRINTEAIKQYEEEARNLKRLQQSPIPITLKYLYDDAEDKSKDTQAENEEKAVEEEVDGITHFPYETNQEIIPTEITAEQKTTLIQDHATEIDQEIRKRFQLQKEMKNWMTAYDNYDDSEVYDENEANLNLNVNYGTPNPNSEISKIPCGGCGALLHCKDSAIPGYIPSEIFSNTLSKGGSNLEAIVCQRCHFLKHYNIALEVQVTPEDYPQVLTSISNKRGIVILMVDLLDFPCSIWPGIGEIFGKRVPVVIVGNKADLLPKDDSKYLARIEKTLIDYVKLSGFATFNIKHTAIISATTGYGVENLITALNSLYKTKGVDFYIVGSTNVGKSSLFNALIRSDFCKSQATDLIQRATTSVWPGTTLNLLKFPVKRPSGYRQHLRQKRLEYEQSRAKEENKFRLQQLRSTRDPQYATLIGHIDITRNPYEKVDEEKDYFDVKPTEDASGILKMGIYEKLPEFKESRWCYDTPGVVQPDQIIHLLTTEELLLTLPKKIIEPRSFCVKPESSLFIGGLSRLDYVKGPGSLRLTVFASEHLPVTICSLQDADDMYSDLLGTPLFKVPKGSEERLGKWPRLEMAKSFTVQGDQWNKSAVDLVLSNSGWIAITGRRAMSYEFQAWTPEKRGCHVRDCLLPHTIALAGHRLKRSVAYKRHRFYLRDT